MWALSIKVSRKWKNNNNNNIKKNFVTKAKGNLISQAMRRPNEASEFELRSGEVYSIQHYVIKFVSDLRQVAGFLRVRLFPPPIKLTATI
jgi:hypothetical protein